MNTPSPCDKCVNLMCSIVMKDGISTSAKCGLDCYDVGSAPAMGNEDCPSFERYPSLPTNEKK